MYKIYADSILIYDSTVDDHRIGKGSITLETNKSGSFSFSVYPDHFYYDKFIRLKTVIKVYKSNRIIFRGRILSDDSDYWNIKNITCEGERGFFQDSIIRPFTFAGTPEEFLKKIIDEHNSQVDEFKRFKLGIVTVVDTEGTFARNNVEYATSFESLEKHLIDDAPGGYLFITHGEDGTEEIPTLNYLVDFTKVSAQSVEFGANLKNYTKKVTAENITTAIIPIGAEIVVGTETDEEGNEVEIKEHLTISDVNNGIDYVYSAEGVKEYGWIFKTMSWNDITDATILKETAEKQLDELVNQNITIELNAIDLHLLDRSIESFNVGDYVRVISKPHNFDGTLLCNKQTIDLLKPENDSLTLGHNYSTFTEKTNKNATVINSISAMRNTVVTFSNEVVKLDKTVTKELTVFSDDTKALAEEVELLKTAIEDIKERLDALEEA